MFLEMPHYAARCELSLDYYTCAICSIYSGAATEVRTPALIITNDRPRRAYDVAPAPIPPFHHRFPQVLLFGAVQVPHYATLVATDDTLQPWPGPAILADLARLPIYAKC